MNIKEDIRKHSAESDKEILFWLLKRYRMESQWLMMAHCHHHRYGDQSYMTHRVWIPTQLGRNVWSLPKLIEALKFYANPDNWKEQETGIGMAPGEAQDDYGALAERALEEFNLPPSPPPAPEWQYDKPSKRYVKVQAVE